MCEQSPGKFVASSVNRFGDISIKGPHTQTHIERKHYLDSFHSIGYRVKGTDIYIPTLTGKPEQQQFIMQSGILTSISNRRRGEINGRPLPE